MAITVKFTSLLFAATAFVLVICLSVSEAAPFFTDNAPSINLPEISLPEMSYLRLPEIDPGTMLRNGGETIARTSNGIIAQLDNGMQAFVRTSSGVMDMFMRMARSLPFIG